MKDKSTVMHIRMKNEEKQELKRLAKLNQYKSVSAYVKELLFGIKHEKAKKHLNELAESLPETEEFSELKYKIENIIDEL